VSDSVLAVRDAERLTSLEETIAQGLTTFVEVGAALAEIRDSRLYRETHKNFTDYCRERWGMDRTHAYRLVDAAEAVRNLSPIGDNAAVPLPATESQARPLTSLPPEQQREVWKKAVETAPTNGNGEPKITAAHVEATVAKHNGNDTAMTMTRTYRGRSSDRTARAAINTLIGLTSGLEAFDIEAVNPTPEELEEWRTELNTAVRAINRIRKELGRA
jgi:hypothetical protein